MERTTMMPGGRRTHADEMQPGMMTDAEIKTELQTATGERLEALQAERESRRVYRAGIRTPRPAL
jgi:hypothetical protein